MGFFESFFGLPDLYECSSEEELEAVTAEAEERTDIAKKTSKALKQKAKTLNANKRIALDNFAFWRIFARSKTEVAQGMKAASKEMESLAPKYADAMMSSKKSEQQAESKVAQLAAKYGQVARGGNSNRYSNSNNQKGLPYRW